MGALTTEGLRVSVVCNGAIRAAAGPCRHKPRVQRGILKAGGRWPGGMGIASGTISRHVHPQRASPDPVVERRGHRGDLTVERDLDPAPFRLDCGLVNREQIELFDLVPP